MRNHSGSDEGSNNSGDPTLKEHEGQPHRAAVDDGDFSVAADHDQAGSGQRTPSAGGRGEVTNDADVVPDGD